MSDWNPKVGERWRWHYRDDGNHEVVFTINKIIGPGVAMGCDQEHSDCPGCCRLLSAELFARKHGPGFWGEWAYEGDEFEKWVRDVREEAACVK